MANLKEQKENMEKQVRFDPLTLSCFDLAGDDHHRPFSYSLGWP